MACPKSWLAFARTVHSQRSSTWWWSRTSSATRNPIAKIYEATLSKLGVVPQDALFVDDRGENIAAADELGLRTFHFTGDDRFGRFQAHLTEELSK